LENTSRALGELLLASNQGRSTQSNNYSMDWCFPAEMMPV